MSYRPREFWDQRLAKQFDLRGTGEPGLSLAYNRACYQLRREALERGLREEGFALAGAQVLDVGCGTGFFTAFYLERGARVTGIDIAPTSIERLRARHPDAAFELGDVSDAALGRRFDLVNAFDVLYHITDESRWERAVRNLAAAVAPRGLLALTDSFPPEHRGEGEPREAAHNRMRPLARYAACLEPAGLKIRRLLPTHVLLNRDLGWFRILNRFPGILLPLDRMLLALGQGHSPGVSKLLIARRMV
jgi:SAM-dependent methyltransferase